MKQPKRRALVLTALPVEYTEVRAHLTDLHEEQDALGTVYEVGSFVHGESNWAMCLSEVGAGNVAAATQVERALLHFRPTVAFFVGVAGGIKDVTIGDVVVATKIYGYESGKDGMGGLLPRPDVGNSAYRLIQRARVEARKGSWHTALGQPDASSVPSVFVGPIAAGEKVVASVQSQTAKFLRAQYGDALAVEMEGAGFLRALHAHPNTDALVIRGISDLLSDKADADRAGSQQVASRNAAAFAMAILAGLGAAPGAYALPRPEKFICEGHHTRPIFLAEDDSSPELLPARPSNIPGSIGTLFKGRDDFLRRLHDQLTGTPGRPAAIVAKQALHGLGGVGKTRLAIEYAHEYADRYSARLFITADSPDSLAPNIAALCGPLVLNEQNSTTDSQVAAVLRWLQTHPGWLLVIDNVDSEPAAQAVESLLDELPPGHVLITSRLSNWSGAIEALELDVLSRDASIALLSERTEGRRIATADDAEEADSIADDLGDLVLALEQSAAYIAKQRIGFRRYRDLWQENEKKVREWHNQRLMKYPRSVATTWKTSIDQLGSGGLTLLRLCSALAPEPIPEGIFTTETAVQGFADMVSVLGVDAVDSTADSVDTEPDFEDAIAELLAYSLARRNHEDQFSLHRLVLQVTDDQLPIEQREQIIFTLAALLIAYAPDDPFYPHTWDVWDLLWAHFSALWQQTSGSLTTDKRIDVGDNLGRYLFGKARFHQCISIWEVMLPAVEAYYGYDSTQVAHVLTCFGEALREVDERPHDALGFFNRALDISRSKHGSKSPKVADALNYLGMAYDNVNQNDKAERAYREALEIYEALSEPSKHRLAMVLGNLAALLRDRGVVREALSIHERAAEIASNVDEKPHIYYSVFLCHYAISLYRANRHDAALGKAKQAVEMAQKTYSQDHHFTIMARGCLANLLEVLNEPRKALKYRRANVDTLMRLGQQEESTVVAIGEVVELLDCLGELKEAIVFQREALSLSVRIRGNEHRDTLLCMAKLADLLQRSGDLDGAAALADRSLTAVIEQTDVEPKIRRETSLLAVKLRRFNLAERLLQQLPRDFEPASTQIHFARIYLLTDRLDEAHAAAEEAWLHHRESTLPYVIPRILFLHALLAALRNEDISLWLGRIKASLQTEGAYLAWRMREVIDHFADRMSDSQRNLFKALIAALSDEKKVEQLNDFDVWSEQAMLSPGDHPPLPP